MFHLKHIFVLYFPFIPLTVPNLHEEKNRFWRKFEEIIALCSVADPWHFGVDADLDPDPSLFVIYLQDANKKTNFLNKFFCLLLFEGTCK